MRFKALLPKPGILCVLFLGSMVYSQEFVIITSERTRIDELTSFQLRNLFLGKLEAIGPDPVFPVQLSEKRPLCQQFLTELFGDHFDWKGYWVDQAVKGGPEKPFSIGSQALMLAFLERNPGYLGFILKSKIDDLKAFKLKQVKITD